VASGNNSKLRTWLNSFLAVRLLSRLLFIFRQSILKARLEIDNDCRISSGVNIQIDNYRALKLHSGVYIGAYSVINALSESNSNPNSFLEIGKGTYIGEQNNIRAGGGKIVIGEKCLISQQVSIIAANHNIKVGADIIDQGWTKEKNFVFIGDGCWIGAGVTILPGVTIGNGAVVAAGSVVRGDVPENAVVGGVPAKFIKQRER
jgi:acetyltransferase-like isoleucine patch superfamily enzyme